jgi:hypothetical protein
MSNPILLIPTREQVQSLKVGDLALDCYGHWSKVTSIFAQKDDVNGRAYVCFYTDQGEGSNISGSYKEGELLRTVPLSFAYTSAQLDVIERRMKGGRHVGPAHLTDGLPPDHHSALQAVAFHLKRRGAQDRSWQELYDDVSRAYRRGDLSDNEHDDLLNLITRLSN